jgi:hypothetical protein
MAMKVALQSQALASARKKCAVNAHHPTNTAYQCDAQERTMARVERGVINPPNQGLQGLDANRSHHRSPDEAPPRPSSATANGNAPGGSADLSKVVSQVVLPSHRFSVDTVFAPPAPAAVEPGKGAVPVNPFLASGPGIARAATLADDAQTL